MHEAIDQVVVKAVGPTVEGCRGDPTFRFFFVRYGALGPHLRIRFCSDRLDLLGAYLESLLGSLSDFGWHTIAGQPRGDLGANTSATGLPGVYIVPYVPEIDRYGGPFCIELAEDAFDTSSALAIPLLEGRTFKRPEERFPIVLTALLTHIGSIASNTYCERELASNYRKWTEGLLPRDFRLHSEDDRLRYSLHSLIVQVNYAISHDLCPLQVKVAKQALCDVLAPRLLHHDSDAGSLPSHAGWTRQKFLREVFPSLLHMTTNRLGLDVHSEVRVARLLEHGMCDTRQSKDSSTDKRFCDRSV